MASDAERGGPARGLWWRVLVAILVWTVIAQIMHWLCAGLSMGYYKDPAYADVWSKLMMPEPGPPPATFHVLSLVFGLVSSALYVGVYVLIRPGIPGKSAALRGLAYGAMLFCVAAVPGALAQVLLLNLPAALIVQWAVEELVIALGAGTLAGLLIK